MLCEAHGHEVVALGNLLPASDDTQELDSYMYQTVGHQLVAAIATCAGLPLFRRRLSGSSKQQALLYDTTAGDEVEDLLVLLMYAKQTMPELQAVSCGAIASDYQRLRAEHVCARLGLTSLAYMWHQPQAALLAQMVDSGVHAVLCKVAAMGLQPKQHLGKSLAQMQPVLHNLRRLYQCNVCGEGGEYETVVLDCPLFKHACIVLDDWSIILHSADMFAPVGLLHPTAFHLAPKVAVSDPKNLLVHHTQDVSDKSQLSGHAAQLSLGSQQPASSATTQTSTSQQLQNSHDGGGVTPAEIIEVPQNFPHVMYTPPGIASSDEAAPEHQVRQHQHDADWHSGNAESASKLQQAAQSLTQLHAASASRDRGPCIDAESKRSPGVSSVQHAARAAHSSVQPDDFVVDVQLQQGEHYTRVICCPSPELDTELTSQGTAKALHSALQAIAKELALTDLTLSHALFVKLYLADMGHFAAANAAYCRHFPAVSPSSRACVQLPLSRGTPLMLEVLLPATLHSLSTRGVLHVQSISNWAPCCIGPYSQATWCGGLLHMAGQIGLHPPSMQLVPGGLTCQLNRCLKSCQDVATACRTDLCNSLLCCTIYTSADIPAGAILPEVTSCLKAFLKGCIDEEFLQSSLSTHSQQAQQSCKMLPAAKVNPNNANGMDCPDESAEASGSELGGDDVSIDADAIDDYLKPPVMQRHWQPLVTVVGVPALPKGALVEVQPEAFTVDAVAEAASSSSSGDDDNGGDDSSIAGLRQSHALAQTDNNRVQGWPGQLQHEQSKIHAPSDFCWSSLIAVGTYCCCQISFEVCDDASALHHGGCMAIRAAGERLQAAGLAAKHIMQACMYVQQLSQDKQRQVEKLFQDVWHAQHGVRLPLLLIPVSHILSGSGCDLRQLTVSQASLHLTAHCA